MKELQTELYHPADIKAMEVWYKAMNIDWTGLVPVLYHFNTPYPPGYVTGRGPIYTIPPTEIPEGMWNPGDLVGHWVRINGDLHKVLGVEMFRPLISPSDPYKHSFGLLV